MLVGSLLDILPGLFLFVCLAHYVPLESLLVDRLLNDGHHHDGLVLRQWRDRGVQSLAAFPPKDLLALVHTSTSNQHTSEHRRIRITVATRRCTHPTISSKASLAACRAVSSSLMLAASCSRTAVP